MMPDILRTDHVKRSTSEQQLEQQHRYENIKKRRQYQADLKGEMHIPYLKYYATNLNQEVAQKNKKNGAPVQYAVGRKDKLQDVMTVLLHYNKTTPFLLGEAGVGKTDVVEGLADALNRNKVPNDLKGYQIYSLNMGLLDTDMVTHQIGHFSDNLTHVMQECERYSDKIILFIDEFQIMAKHKDAQLLKAPLARGRIKLIGATTYDEFFDFISGDRAMQRRLSRVMLPEPNKKITFKILRLNTAGYTKHYHGITIDDNVLKLVVELSARYMPDQVMPDKAFDILDDTLAEALQRHHSQATQSDVSLAIMHKTNIPMSSIALALQPQIADLSTKLHKRIKGQNKAINDVVNAIDMFYAGLNDPNKPNASFLFLGTTGVGKTEMAKAIAQALFGSEHAMIRLDMASFNTKDASAKLIGTRGKRGILTEAVRRQPYGVLLLDEIEKSYKSVWDLLLSILDDGEIQDSRGRTVDFSNLIIIMTSNLASETIKTRRAYYPRVDLTHASKRQKEAQDMGDREFGREVDAALKRTFKPELVNRLSNRIVFNILDKPQIVQISQKYMQDLIHRLRRNGYDLLFDFKTIDYVTDMGTDIDNGARPLQRAINHMIAGPIGRLIIRMKSSPDWNTKWKYDHTFVIKTTGQHPTKHDLIGSRTMSFKIVPQRVTKQQAQKRKQLFSKANIKRMVILYNEDEQARENYRSAVRDNIQSMKAEKQPEQLGSPQDL